MKKFLKNVDKRKFLGTIVGLILFSCVAFYFTYARYEWRSADTNVTINFEDVMLEFENGGNVNVSNIGPILNYTDGVKANFTATSIAGKTFPFVIKLDITSISETLLVESFKYKLMRDTSGGTNYTEEVASGNFSGFRVGENTIYVETMAPTSVYSYQFVVYIDGRIHNNNNMQENSLVSTLIVSDDDAITDYSGNNNHAVNMGATWDMENGTVTTNGTSSFVNLGLAGYDFGDSMSFVTRVKFDTALTESRNYSFLANTQLAGMGLWWNNNYKKFGFGYYSSGSELYITAYQEDNSTLSLNTWYTIVGTFYQGTVSLYINGEKIATNTDSTTSITISPFPVVLGAEPVSNYTASEWAPATFDSALIFDRALTESEIATDYAGVVNPTNKTDLLGYYTFDY